MTLAPRLDLRQSQSLVMTPQLQQAIKLLALSNLEIEAFVAGELEKNPLLEAGGTDDFAPPADGVDRAAEQHDLRAETGDADQLIGQGQIGSASCRERVCQYVSIPVVAGALKKKQQ